MLQKKNSDMCELARAKTGRVYGDFVTLLTITKGLPLAYNCGMQEKREPIFNALDMAKMFFSVFSPLLASIKVISERMCEAYGDSPLLASIKVNSERMCEAYGDRSSLAICEAGCSVS